MDKVLVSVFVPSVDDTYNIQIPINLEMKDVINFIQEAIADITGEAYKVDPNARLYDRNTGCLINTNNIVKFSGLKNGALLMLISIK